MKLERISMLVVRVVVTVCMLISTVNAPAVVLAEPVDSVSPVVLVPGVIGYSPDGWAQPGKKNNLYHDLVSRGFRPERQLFTLLRSDPHDEGGFAVDVSSLRSMIRRAYELAGCQPVDLITHGEGALLVKAAVAGTTLPVRNIVAISPPHRGSTHLHISRVAHEQEAYLSLHNRQRGRIAHDRVVDRAIRIFEPLYHQYVMSHLLGSDAKLLGFDKWLMARHQQRMHQLFTDNSRGPCGVLTTAYYDLLAMNAARYRYAYGESSQSLSRLKAALQPLIRLIQIAVDPIIGSVLDVIGGMVLNVSYRWQTSRKANLGLIKPLTVTDRAVIRMYPEQLDEPRELTANGWLAAINNRTSAGMRWVTVIPSGDQLVNLDAFSLPGTDDFWHLFTGPGRTDHNRIMGNTAVWDKIYEHLHLYPGRKAYTLDERFYISETTVTTSWLPIYTELTVADQTPLAVSIFVHSPVSVVAWLDVHEEDGQTRRRFGVPERDGRVSFFVEKPEPGQTYVVGYRTVSRERPAPVTLDVTTESQPDTVYERPDVAPHIVVQRSTKRTTVLEPRTTIHQRWEWDFGDGNTLILDGPEHTTMDISHQYERAGVYDVRAVSFDNWGRMLGVFSWIVDGKQETGAFAHSFTVTSVGDPAVSVTIDGPSEWMAGLPAVYQVSAIPDQVPGLIRQVVRIDPGPEFSVQWPRPGVFPVTVAVIVERTYLIDGREVTTEHVSLHSRSVVVLGTSVRD